MLAAYAPFDDLLYSFYYTNLILLGIGGLLLSVWLQLRLRLLSLRLLAVFIFGWAAFGPLRFTTFYPTNAEPLTFVLIMLNFLVIDAYLRSRRARWYAAILVLAAAGSVTRELALVPAFALVFADIRIDWSAFRRLPKVWFVLSAILAPFLRADRLMLYLPLVIGVAGMTIVRQVIPEIYPFSFLAHAASGWATTNDLRLLTGLVAMLGPIAFVALFRPAFLLTWFSRRAFYAAYMVTGLFLGYTNLPDERFFIYLLPVLFLFIDASLRHHYELGRDALFWLMAFVFTAVAIRAYLVAPEFGIDVPPLPIWQEALSRFLPKSGDLWSTWIYVAPAKTVITTLAVFVLMGWLLWLRAEACRKPKEEEGGAESQLPNAKSP